MAGTGSSRAPQITRISPAGKGQLGARTCIMPPPPNLAPLSGPQSCHPIAQGPAASGHLRAQHIEHCILLLHQTGNLHLRGSERIARRK